VIDAALGLPDVPVARERRAAVAGSGRDGDSPDEAEYQCAVRPPGGRAGGVAGGGLVSWSRPVFSDVISEVGWDETSQELIITFKRGGAMWGYAGADEAFADQLSRAASVGGMFHAEVKNQLAGRRIR